MDNPYTLKTVFTVHEAAAAIHSVKRLHRDDLPLLRSTMDELIRAMESGALPCNQAPRYIKEYSEPGRIRVGEVPRLKHAGTDWFQSTIARADLLTWCEQRQIRPSLLFPDSPPTEKPLHDRERETLLSIIRALAELHGVHPVQTRQDGDGWRKAAEALLEECACRKINPPVADPKTLTKHLRNAFANGNEIHSR